MLMQKAAAPDQYGLVTDRAGSCLLMELEAGLVVGMGVHSDLQLDMNHTYPYFRTLINMNQKGQNLKAVIWKPSRL